MSNKPVETEETWSEDDSILEKFHRESRELASSMLKEDPESDFGLMMYEATKETSESPVKGPSRRGEIYALRAKRIKRLASLILEMTPFQERFVHHYVQKNWDSLADLAIMAGSTATTSQNLRNVAYQNLKNKKVIEAIGLMTYSKLEAEGIDRHEVIGMFRNNHAAAYVDGDYKEANIAAEKLGIAVGLFPGGKQGISKAVAATMTNIDKSQLNELNKASGGNKTIYEQTGEAPSSDALVLNEDLKNHLAIATGKRSLN